MHSHSSGRFGPAWRSRHTAGMLLNSLRLGSGQWRRSMAGAFSSGSSRGPQQALPDGLTRLLRLSAMAAAGAGVTVLALPAVLNTPPGLQAALVLLNSLMPGPQLGCSVQLPPDAAPPHISTAIVRNGAHTGKVQVQSLELSLPGWSHALVNLKGVEVHEPEHLGAQLLLSAQEIACTGSPLQLIRGNASKITISGATINGAYNSEARDFRLIRYLESAGVLEAPPPRTPEPPPSSPVPGPHPPGSDEQAQLDSDASPPPPARDNKAGSESQQGSAPEAAAKEPGRFTRVLCDVNSRVALSGHLRQPGLELIMQDSELLVSHDMRLILGGDMHVLGAFGPENIRWLQSQVRPAADVEHPGAASSNNDPGSAPSSHAITTEQSARAGQGAADWWESAPTHAEAAKKLLDVFKNRGGHCAEPGEWQVRAPNLDMQMRVWKVGAPRSGADKPELSYTLLHQPGAMSLKFTEALGRFALAAINPLLGTVSNVTEQHQGALKATFIPDGGMLPYTSASMIVEPMCLQLGTNPLLAELARWVKVPGVSLEDCVEPSKTKKHAAAVKTGNGGEVVDDKRAGDELQQGASQAADELQKDPQQAAEEQQQGAQQAADDLVASDDLLSDDSLAGVGKLQAAGSEQLAGSQQHSEAGSASSEKRGGKREQHNDGEDRGELLEAWLSGMHIRFERSGVIQQKRVDMLIGPAGMQSGVQRGGRKARRAMKTAMHLVLWGSADPDTDQIDFVVGLPDDLLGRIGIKHLPHNYCLPIRLTGSMDAPELQVAGLTRRIKHLFVHHVAQIKKRKQEGQSEELTEEHHANDSTVKQVVRAGKWLLSTAIWLWGPKGQQLVEIDAQIQKDAQTVPEQECEVPWQAA